MKHDRTKRAFDLLFSLLMLIVFSPLLLLIALLIRLVSPGPIFYVQKRIGKGGKPFACIKFRTMYPQADRRLRKILNQNPKLAFEWLRKQKLSEDPRIFPLGRFLRKYSLDEFPQFINVLKGDLSVVGPRPYLNSQSKRLGSYQEKILSLRPGITGLWQISGRSNTTFEERISLDARYVDRASFLYDLQLIGKTIPEVLLPKDAC